MKACSRFANSYRIANFGTDLLPCFDSMRERDIRAGDRFP